MLSVIQYRSNIKIYKPSRTRSTITDHWWCTTRIPTCTTPALSTWLMLQPALLSKYYYALASPLATLWCYYLILSTTEYGSIYARPFIHCHNNAISAIPRACRLLAGMLFNIVVYQSIQHARWQIISAGIVAVYSSNQAWFWRGASACTRDAHPSIQRPYYGPPTIAV